MSASVWWLAPGAGRLAQPAIVPLTVAVCDRGRIRIADRDRQVHAVDADPGDGRVAARGDRHRHRPRRAPGSCRARTWRGRSNRSAPRRPRDRTNRRRGPWRWRSPSRVSSSVTWTYRVPVIAPSPTPPPGIRRGVGGPSTPPQPTAGPPTARKVKERSLRMASSSTQPAAKKKNKFARAGASGGATLPYRGVATGASCTRTKSTSAVLPTAIGDGGRHLDDLPLDRPGQAARPPRSACTAPGPRTRGSRRRDRRRSRPPSSAARWRVDR